MADVLRICFVEQNNQHQLHTYANNSHPDASASSLFFVFKSVAFDLQFNLLDVPWPLKDWRLPFFPPVPAAMAQQSSASISLQP